MASEPMKRSDLLLEVVACPLCGARVQRRSLAFKHKCKEVKPGKQLENVEEVRAKLQQMAEEKLKRRMAAAAASATSINW